MLQSWLADDDQAQAVPSRIVIRYQPFNTGIYKAATMVCFTLLKQHWLLVDRELSSKEYQTASLSNIEHPSKPLRVPNPLVVRTSAIHLFVCEGKAAPKTSSKRSESDCHI